MQRRHVSTPNLQGLPSLSLGVLMHVICAFAVSCVITASGGPASAARRACTAGSISVLLSSTLEAWTFPILLQVVTQSGDSLAGTSTHVNASEWARGQARLRSGSRVKQHNDLRALRSGPRRL
jgi:hypothetical protein